MSPLYTRGNEQKIPNKNPLKMGELQFLYVDGADIDAYRTQSFTSVHGKLKKRVIRMPKKNLNMIHVLELAMV